MPPPLEQAILFTMTCTELEVVFIVRAQLTSIQEQQGSRVGTTFCIQKTQ